MNTLININTCHITSSNHRPFYTFLHSTILSLLLALSTPAQTTQSPGDSTPFTPIPKELLEDSMLTKKIEHNINMIGQTGLSENTRKQLIQQLIDQISFVFDISPENVYIKIRNNIIPLKIFLTTFYEEYYRDPQKLRLCITQYLQKQDKLYIVIDYLYTLKTQ